MSSNRMVRISSDPTSFMTSVIDKINEKKRYVTQPISGKRKGIYSSLNRNF